MEFVSREYNAIKGTSEVFKTSDVSTVTPASPYHKSMLPIYLLPSSFG